MSADLIQGKKGSGKSKLAVMLIREHLLEDRLVATNLDLFLDKLMPPMSRAYALRIPDKPCSADLVAIGSGNNGDRYNEDHDGLLVLDELATWLNARTFADKDRGAVMDWLVHSRKLGWGTKLICQDLVQIDKQARESQVEYVTRCIRMDRMRIPVVGSLIAMLFGEKAAYMLRMHIATRRLGLDPKGLVAQKWWYRDGGVQDGYDTLQVFQHDYPHGTHCLLSAWHLVGRFMPEQKTFFQRVRDWFTGPTPRAAVNRRPKLPIVASVMALPPDERIKHVRRLDRLGLLAVVPAPVRSAGAGTAAGGP